MFNLAARDFRRNIISGLLVSFIALPLCLAIATASGFPILSGILTAIIGGIIVSQIGGSFVTINGPAAGMIVVIIDSIERLGQDNAIFGYKCTLAAIMVAASLQIATSFTKLPEMMRKFPEVIMRGMIASIGIIVILKQIFVVLGYKTPHDSMIRLFIDIPYAVFGAQLETVAISIFVILFIMIWNKKVKSGFAATIPVYLVVIVTGSILTFLLKIETNPHYLMESFSVKPASLFVVLPHSISEAFALPIFDKLFTREFALSVFTIYAVGSLEAILSVISVDKLDPQKRTSNLKKDLRGIGIGNLICGACGALPMIAEIVRSSANIKYGATNKWSNFFHGVFLLIFVTVLSKFIAFIPLCVLAAMLILIGWNLINTKLIHDMYKEWKPSILVILSIVALTVWIDLLAGIAAGIGVYLLFKAARNT